MITKIFRTKEFAIRKYCHYTHRDKKTLDGGGCIVKLGHPFLGWYIKMGQVRTKDGWQACCCLLYLVSILKQLIASEGRVFINN